jgi:hypothetical protein
MFRKRWLAAFAIYLLLSFGAFAQGADKVPGETLRVDIPITLENAKVVIDFGHLVFNRDMPFALGDIHLLAGNFSDWNTKGQIVVIFHGDAAYLVLNDEAYNSNRGVVSGNPYKALLMGLMKQGVQLELCGRQREEITGAMPTSSRGSRSTSMRWRD